MDLSDLLKRNEIRKVAPDKLQADENLKAAERDIDVAEKTIKISSDWAFIVAYNALLHAARALMFYEGYEVCGENKHKIAMDYINVKFGVKYQSDVEMIDRIRRKRHIAMYDVVESISPNEVDVAITTAKKVLNLVKEKIGN